MTRITKLALAALLTGLLLTTSAFAQEEEEAQTLPQPTAEQALIDAKAIHELYDKHKDAFEGIYGGVSVGETSVGRTLELCAEHIAKIEALEADVLPEMEPVLARVTELWAPKPEEGDEDDEPMTVGDLAYQQGGDVEWNMKTAATNDGETDKRDLPDDFDDISTHYIRLAKMLSNVAETRVANAEYLTAMVKNQPALDFFVEDIRVDKMNEYKVILDYAIRFDPSNEYANDRLATLDGEIAAMEKAIEADIDARKWAGNADGAPGHAGAGLAWLQNHPNWGKNAQDTTVLNVCVRGGWVPGERDIFGRIINWGLPIHVAVSKPKWAAKTRVRVYELTLISQGPKAPPFGKYWVGDSWYVRPTALP